MSGQDRPQSDTVPSDLDVARLDGWLASHLDGFGRLVSIDKFAAGQSNPTYRFSDGARSFVLRRKPFGPLLRSAHAIEREFRLISGLHPSGFPVARPYVLCEDDAVIGSAFYIMALVEGRNVGDGAMPGQSREDRAGMYHAMIATLARLHAIDPATVGLADYGAEGNYFERQVRRWTKQYRAAQTELVPEIERLIEWLPTTLPAQDRVSIIHGDYRVDNIIFAPDRSEVAAVLDWELSTLGDPLADFAYLAMNWVLPNADRPAQLEGLDLEALGIPDMQDAVEIYCGLTGRSRVPDLNWYFAYNLFRLVGIVQGIKKRLQDGNASSAEAEEVAEKVTPMARKAWEFARQAGAPA